MRKSWFFGLVISFAIQFAQAGHLEYRDKITETRTCAATLTVLFDHTLHVQGLDNTIMRTAQTLGSDQWYGDLVSRFTAEGLTKDRAIEKAIGMWLQVQEVTKMVAVEDFIPNMISYLIQGRDLLRDAALTARPPELAGASLRQLASLGIDFSKRNPFGGGKKILVHSPEFIEPVLIEGGVIFVGPKNEKGKVLAFLLDPKNGFNNYAAGFEHIVYADDKLHHSESVLKEVLARFPELSVYAFRDGAADDQVKSYDRTIADFQWEEFQRSGNIISDEEALQRLNNPTISFLPPRDGLIVDADVFEAFSTGNGVSISRRNNVIIRRSLQVEIVIRQDFEKAVNELELSELQRMRTMPNSLVSFEMMMIISRRLQTEDPSGKKFFFGQSVPYDKPNRLVAGINVETLNWLSQHPELISHISLHRDDVTTTRLVRL